MTRVIACIDASPCVIATAEAAVWIAQKTGRRLTLLQVLDYRPPSYHLGEIGGIIGFESNAMLLKEIDLLDEQQYQLAQQYSDELLAHISKHIYEKYNIKVDVIQRRGEFLDQAFEELRKEDIAVIGKVGDRAAEKKKPCGSHVEGIIRGSKSTVLIVGESFVAPSSFLFAYEHSTVCNAMLKRVGKSELLKLLSCHLIHIGDQNGILEEPIEYLQYSGFDVQAMYIYGTVIDELLNYQQSHHIDLVVMGAFSHSKIHQFFLGSTTLEMFKRSQVPMLVLR